MSPIKPESIAFGKDQNETFEEKTTPQSGGKGGGT